MNSIINNPFRILGISANTAVEDIQDRKAKMTTFYQIEDKNVYDYDFSILKSIVRDMNCFNQAFPALETDHDKINHALFWFINANSVDNLAIQRLKEGNVAEAFDLWSTVIHQDGIKTDNYTAYNNISTLHLLSDCQDQIKKGIALKLTLLESSYFNDLIKDVLGNSIVIDIKKQKESFIDTLLKDLKKNYSTAILTSFFADCSFPIQHYFIQKYTEEYILNINRHLENCKGTRIQNKGLAFRSAELLVTNSHEDFEYLLKAIGRDNLQYNTLRDLVAKELLLCSFDHFTTIYETLDDEGIHKVVTLLHIASQYAVTKVLLDEVSYTLLDIDKIKTNTIYN